MMSLTGKSAFSILLIEDDDVAVEAATRSLRKCGLDQPIYTAANGAEGLAALRGNGPHGVLPKATIVLLDLNMPVMNGFEFLDALRADTALRSRVVFVLTTSDADDDLTRAYHHCIAGYMVKSAVGNQLANLANLLKSYVAAITLA
ncbi:response regulator [Janthinobacterium sp. PC23-8]|uniref:response regulator n=1 Tax=Janthinobacterium sp. PC23-8 TaxID=2012679 RepID=UPI001C3C539D|nr:response regulator [Janthinobacterium sp. PC23-8]